MTTQIMTQFNSQGFELKGVLHLPENENPPLVIGSHGLEGSKESAKQLVLSRLLPKNGMAFFRFDHRGCGESQGSFINDTSLLKRSTDFLAAVDHALSLRKTARRIAVFGSSMGGATCINTWSDLLNLKIEVCGMVLCSAPVKSRTIDKIPTQATDNRPALPLSFFRNNLLFNITDKTSQLTNLLVFHGDADEVVPVSNARTIFSHARDPKQLIIHKNGDHQMTDPEHQAQFEKLTPQWFMECFSSAQK